MDNKVISIGEMLIDFTAQSIGNIKSVNGFTKNPGGAPANVAVCVSRLGGKAAFISKLGEDAFGEFLIGVLKENNVDTQYIKRTAEANTALAFVSLDDNGDRDFLFYRKPSSDLFLSESDIADDCINEGDILHFCSVSLVDYPVKRAHMQAIKNALARNVLISFDPNLRYNLWDSKQQLIDTVNEFIPYAHLLKVGDEELAVLTQLCDESEAAKKIMTGNVQCVIVTKGRGGATAYLKSGEVFASKGRRVKCVDATGAGDIFIGTVLYQLLRDGADVKSICGESKRFIKYLEYANKAAAKSVTMRGAIPSMPMGEEIF